MKTNEKIETTIIGPTKVEFRTYSAYKKPIKIISAKNIIISDEIGIYKA